MQSRPAGDDRAAPCQLLPFQPVSTAQDLGLRGSGKNSEHPEEGGRDRDRQTQTERQIDRQTDREPSSGGVGRSQEEMRGEGGGKGRMRRGEEKEKEGEEGDRRVGYEAQTLIV